jgi:MFS family permease
LTDLADENIVEKAILENRGKLPWGSVKISVTATYSPKKVKNSLKYSILDGSAFSAMLGFTQSYITPFALALKASTSEIGLLASIPNLTMALSQLSAPDLSARAGTRLKFILPVVFLHALMFIPILLIPFILPGSKIWWLIGLITVSTVLGAIANPAWGSMMADLVPDRVRGRYFSFRSRIAGFIVLVASLIAGGILQLFSNNVFIGFAIIFGGAAIFRWLSLYFLSRMYEPPIEVAKDTGPGLLYRVTHLASTNFGRYTVYVALINFAASISGPFFAVFMLRDLGWSYAYYLIIICTNAISNLAFQTFWGRRADMAGNLKVVRLTSFLIPIVPLLWLVSTNIGFLVFEEVISGFAWGGFQLASSNFVYDATEPERRTKQIALYNAVIGIAICVGSVIGGFIAPLLPSLFGYQLRSLFTLSGVLRGLIAILFLGTILEVRRVPKVSWLQFFRGGLNPAAMKTIILLK